MADMILMTAHGLSSDALNSDGSLRHSVADTTGLTDRLGYRPVFCTRLYPDDLMQSWLAVFASAPRYVDVVDIFTVDESEVLPIDSWYWTQYCLGNESGSHSWSDLKEPVFDVSNLLPWQQEYLVKSIPDDSIKIQLHSLTQDCDIFFSSFMHDVLGASDYVCDVVRDNLGYLRDNTIEYTRAVHGSGQISAEEWYQAFVMHTGVFAFLWGIVCHREIVGWWSNISLPRMSQFITDAFRLRQTWDASGGSCGGGGFSREDFLRMGQRFYACLDGVANLCASDWKRDLYPEVGRNDLCPCGSGRKFKKCHGGSHGFAWLYDNPFSGA